ncbi:MAG: HI1506-related protein [Eubacteriales bacterium]|nr:HI1506-related protein [Eubacteriales bacterium]
MPAIKIISKKDGFRRCGVAHPAAPVIYPDGTFSKDQVKDLKAEPMLIVEEVKEPKPKAGAHSSAGDQTPGGQDGPENPGGDK